MQRGLQRALISRLWYWLPAACLYRCYYIGVHGTNNGVECWHYRLSRKASQCGLNMYLLFGLLAHEAEMVAINVNE